MRNYACGFAMQELKNKHYALLTLKSNYKHQFMTNQQILPPQEFSSLQHPSKFSIGQEVVWAYVEAHDHGTIVGCVWTNHN